MKKYMQIIVQFKFVWGLFFTASILLYTMVSMILGESSMEFILIWKFVAITLILTFIHYIVFGEFILNSLSPKYKVAVHFVLCYITTLISANILNWINVLNLSSVAIFTAGYIFLYLSLTLSFYVYYKATGEKLNNRLAVYKQRKTIN